MRPLAAPLPPAAALLLAGLLLLLGAAAAEANPERWAREWPDTDFSRHSVAYDEILSGGPPKDGIPSIDDPQFTSLESADDLAPTEPVMGLEINGDARAYPLRILIWHEIVNDEVGGVPVAVTYCPLCNSGIVFDRRLGDRVLEFGTTGKLRYSDLVMYDRQTESWWQQFLGEAIVGELTGERLDIIPARLESLERFAERHPDGRVLVPNRPSMRAYGQNPYVGYDSAAQPFLFRGDYDGPVPPLSRLVAVGDRAWSLQLLREAGRIEAGELVLSWAPGQNSALDTQDITAGDDVGNVVVQRRTAEGALEDIAYDVPFAFAFAALRPNAEIIAE
ncbi:MAG: DUF3179 domain-containing protein [Alphaproteobacteria bacterium]|jgi:hypothetical protein|nr:DUF3179 domain-containing protein [Alphaproteobacteria bacterium]